jgi:hypothetical protein
MVLIGLYKILFASRDEESPRDRATATEICSAEPVMRLTECGEEESLTGRALPIECATAEPGVSECGDDAPHSDKEPDTEFGEKVCVNDQTAASECGSVEQVDRLTECGQVECLTGRTTAPECCSAEPLFESREEESLTGRATATASECGSAEPVDRLTECGKVEGLNGRATANECGSADPVDRLTECGEEERLTGRAISTECGTAEPGVRVSECGRAEPTVRGEKECLASQANVTECESDKQLERLTESDKEECVTDQAISRVECGTAEYNIAEPSHVKMSTPDLLSGLVQIQNFQL